MNRNAFRAWVWVHTWSSLVCTLFLLVICISGLPLVFREEIVELLDDGLPYARLAEGTPNASLDRFAELSHKIYPNEILVSIYIDDDEPHALVWMAPSWAAYNADRKSGHWIRFDARTADVLKQSQPINQQRPSFLGIMVNLHKDLFAGLPGEVFLAVMAVLFVAAIVSGIAIYGPFARRIDFGTIRSHRSARMKWLDLHNLIGITTLAWGLVVGVTGFINQLSTPLFGLWLQTDVAAILRPLQGKPVPAQSDLSSPQAAFDRVQAALPEMRMTSIVYPGAIFASPTHYLIWTKGKEPLTSRLFTPVLVDARSGQIEHVVTMPWYLRALQVSRPLHFGDYGGLPLKVIWALLDLTTIVILGSGLFLWVSRRSSKARRPR